MSEAAYIMGERNTMRSLDGDERAADGMDAALRLGECDGSTMIV